MKIMKSICLALIAVIAAELSASGEQFRTDINPALLYYQAFLVEPKLEQADHDYLFTNNWGGQRLPERFGLLIAAYNTEFKLVRQAAQAKVPCDFGIDISPGPATLLSHLARIKVVAQTARLRAMWDLQNGDQAAARDDLLAAFALARNVAQDHILISGLVQIASEMILYSTVAENFYQFSPEILQQLVDGFDAAPARGTIAACIPMEKLSCHDWLEGRILELQKVNLGNDAKVMTGIHESFGGMENSEQGETNLWEQVTKAAGGTSDGVIKLLREMDPLYPRLTMIMTLPPSEYEAQMKLFSAEVQKSQNPLVPELFNALLKCRQREFRVQVSLAMVRAAVEYKLHGEPGLKSVTDPCGKGPFALRRFVFDGVDRGFEVKSAYDAFGFPELLIFVEKEGSPFRLNGPHAGEALPKPSIANE